MKCPVCKSNIVSSETKCAHCGFTELSREFVNVTDAVDWVENVVTPYRLSWESSNVQEDASALYESLISAQMSVSKSSAIDFADVEYTIEDGCITITKYISTKSNYSVPSLINGLPVACIADRAFYGCKELEKIVIPQTVKYIGKEVFMGSGIREIIFPKSVLTISESVCKDCKQLETVVVLGAEIIEENAFRACKKLSKVAFSDTLRQISNGAFFDCTSLKTIHIPASVVEMSEGAFATEGARQDPYNYKKWYVAEWVWNDDVLHKTADEVREFFFFGNTTNFVSFRAPHCAMYSEKCIFRCNPGSDAQAYARAHNMTVKPII